MQSCHRTVTAANKLSIYEAVSSWCYNQTVPETTLSAVTTTQPVPETLVSYLVIHTTGNQCARRDPMRDRDRRFANLTDEAKIAKVCEDAGFVRTVQRGHCFSSGSGLTQSDKGRKCREYTLLRQTDKCYPTGWAPHQKWTSADSESF